MDTTNEHLDALRAYVANAPTNERDENTNTQRARAAAAGYDPDKEFGQDAHDEGDESDDFESRRDPAHVYLPGDEDADEHHDEDADEEQAMPAGHVRRIPLTALLRGKGFQPRCEGLSEDNLDSLRASDPATWPPLLVAPSSTDGAYVVIDGYHRLAVAQELALPDLPCISRDDVRSMDALYDLAFAANLTHGAPYTKADRKAHAQRLHERYPEMSYRAIGQRCGLDHKTVSSLLVGEIPQQPGNEKPTRPPIERQDDDQDDDQDAGDDTENDEPTTLAGELSSIVGLAFDEGLFSDAQIVTNTEAYITNALNALPAIQRAADALTLWQVGQVFIAAARRVDPSLTHHNAHNAHSAT